MKKLLMIALVVLVAVACNKNQSAVKKLDGKWNTTKMTVTEDGKSIDLISLGTDVKFNFTKCKLKTDEFCDMTVTTTFDGDSETTNSVFKVTNDGKSLVTADSDTTSNTTTMEILELTKTNAKLTYTEDGGTTDIELEKID